jgi:AcrR family transcriptional regulator
MARPKSDIQHRIVVAARERFVTEGVDGASLRTIAADAGTNVGMIYYYFKTKDDLFLAVVEDVYGALIHDLEAAMSEGHAAPDKLRRAFVRIGHMSDLELTTMRLVLREALGSTARLERLIPRFVTGHIGLLLGTIAEGIGSGALRDDMPAPILMMTAVAMGVAPQIARRVAGHRIPIGAIETEPLADLSVRLWMEGAGRRKKG